MAVTFHHSRWKAVGMLHCFPTPQPDELFYSVIARFSERMRLSRKYEIQEHIWGKREFCVGIELPRSLDALVRQLPLGHELTADRLIDRHTLFGFYAPFIVSSSRQAVRTAMRGVKIKNVSLIIGHGQGAQFSLRWLRFCPTCVFQDKQMLGEPIWRRLHQIKGVEVCPDHKVFLENSIASRGGLPGHKGVYTVLSARSSCDDRPPRKIDPSNKDHLALLEIAQDAECLLGGNTSYVELPVLKRRFRELMFMQGLANGLGLNHLKCRDAIQSRFSDKVLESLGCSVSAKGPCKWVARLISGYDRGPQNPLCYIVLIRTLGYSMFSVLSSSTPTLFGKGPWPCQNRVCPNFERNVITDYEVIFNDDRLIVGLFCCNHCGHNYMARGVLGSTEAPFSLIKVRDHGHLWRDKLVELWNKQEPVESIKKALGCAHQTVTAHAIKLGLPNHVSKRVRATPAEFAARIREKRQRWLDLRSKYPRASRSELYKQDRSLSIWLRKFDCDWLHAHSPASLSHRGSRGGPRGGLTGRSAVGLNPQQSSSELNRVARDRDYAERVKKAAEELFSEADRPVQITRAAISRKISVTLGSNHILRKLPQTQDALDKLVESNEDFALRKLASIFEQFRAGSVRPSKSKIIRTAGISTIFKKSPTIQAAISSFLSSW